VSSIVVLALALAAAGCERRSAEARPGAPRLSSPALLVTAAQSKASATPIAKAMPDGSWVAALRAGRYSDAARALDAESGLARRPELKLARARAAIELGDAARAVTLLSGLESELPVLEARIGLMRAEAQLNAGPYAEAATYYAKRTDPSSVARAALARERAGEFAEASALADRVVSDLKGKRLHSVEALARSVRARASTKIGKKAQAANDLRWLALEDAVASPDVDLHLSTVAPGRALTKEERLGRALEFGRAGAVERAEAELERLSKAPGPAITSARLERARAFALYYSRRDYKKASELFTRAARGPGADAAECTFYAARSLARAQDDERAVRAYRDLKGRYPRSSYAEQAGYLIARTHYAAGRFADAAKAYDAYLAEYARGKSRADAVYERAISWLALGRNEPAAAAFESLRRTERDARRATRLRHLEGVARAAAGQTQRAAALFVEVVNEQPLGFTALAAAERLAEIKGLAPAIVPSAKAAGMLPALNARLPDGVGLLRGIGLDRDAELELTRAEASLKQRFGARAGEGLCQAYGELDVAARRYQIAQAEVDRRVLQVAPSSTTRWQWECVYPRPYRAAVPDAAREADVPEALLYAVMRQESAFKQDAASPAGARGLMQIMPGTAERLAGELGEPYDPGALGQPATSLRYSAHYLSKLLKAFGANVPLAAAAYNAGPVALRRWLEGGKELPLDVFVARIPYEETLEYVERVVGNFARYRYLEAGAGGVPRLALELPAIAPATEPEY
jgi:soluble lytic murein transglycosylase